MNPIISYYNQAAKTYDESRFNNSYGKFIDRQERYVLDQLIRDPNEVVLDLACGSGRFLNYANYGVDASPDMVEIAKEKNPSKPVFISTADQLPFEDNSINTIIAFHFFMHLTPDDLGTVLNECHRVLKKNGRIIFDIPSKKRRNLSGYKVHDWHGALSFTIDEIKKLHQNFSVQQYVGIKFLPIHRFPESVRKYLFFPDYLLGHSLLKEYSSYLMIEYKKV